ncbi:MAG: DUF1015 domain-containing protein [Dehalococcoidia bacterium]
MVDFRPFRGLRYTAKAGPLSELISPPYDVLSLEQVDQLRARNPANVIQLEHPAVALRREPQPYAAAARKLAEWRDQGLLRRDEAPGYYVYDQHFVEGGDERRRTVIYGRLRLSPWEQGEVLPHEYTMAGPKQDRLQLMEALRANISPLYLLYDDPDGHLTRLVRRAEEFGPVAEAEGTGERHVLRLLNDPVIVGSLEQEFVRKRLYMADGHHRYETAVAFRERHPDEPGAGFAMVGLTAGSDLGLSVHATHRLYSGDVDGRELREKMTGDWAIEAVTEADLLHRLEGPNAVLGVAGLEDRETLYLLRPLHLDELAARVGEGPEVWRRLDVNLLQHVILGEYLGLDPTEPNQPGLSYVHTAEEAIAAVREGKTELAFLLRPISPRELFAVSDTGVRLPQKSTYFYPKLPTGLVLNPLD